MGPWTTQSSARLYVGGGGCRRPPARAPNSIERFELAASPAPLGQGNEISVISDGLLDAIYDAYREANG